MYALFTFHSSGIFQSKTLVCTFNAFNFEFGNFFFESLKRVFEHHCQLDYVEYQIFYEQN